MRRQHAHTVAPSDTAGRTGCPNGECGLVRPLAVLHHTMMRLADRLAAPIGLTGARWLLLSAVARAGEPCTAGQLSDEALMSVQNVSRMLAALESEGFVRRFQRPGHGRAVFAELTPKGSRAIQRTQSMADRFRRHFHAGLVPADVGRIESYLQRLLRNLCEFERELDRT